jgi:hypothetical protein
MPPIAVLAVITPNYRGDFMSRETLKEQLKQAKNKKFQTMYDRIPFLQDLTYDERTWWIRYYKLKHTWKTNFPNQDFHPDNYIPFTGIKPWEKPNYLNGYLGFNHDVNCDLLDIEILFMKLGYDWVHVKLEDIKFPEVIDCNYDGVSFTCQDCRYRFKCELRGEKYAKTFRK